MPNLYDDESDDETIVDLPSEDVSASDTRYAAVLAALDAIAEKPDEAAFKAQLTEALNRGEPVVEHVDSAIELLAVKAAQSDSAWFIEQLEQANARVAAQFNEPEPVEEVEEATWVDNLSLEAHTALFNLALHRPARTPAGYSEVEWLAVRRQAGV